MPAGVSLSMIIIHPDWKPALLKKVESAASMVSAVTLLKGVPVEIVLKTAGGGKPIADATEAEVLMIVSQGGPAGGMTINHPFEVRDQRIRFHAEATSFSQLRVETNDYFVGPILLNFPNLEFEKLNLAALKSSTIELTAMTGAGGASTDSNGDYEIELSDGTASVEVIRNGFYSMKEIGEFVVVLSADLPRWLYHLQDGQGEQRSKEAQEYLENVTTKYVGESLRDSQVPASRRDAAT